MSVTRWCTSPNPSITVTDTAPLFDEPIEITITGCRPNSEVTLQTRMCLPDGVYESALTYVSDQRGTIDLATVTPIEFESHVPAPMAPFWAMEPIDRQRQAPPEALVRSVGATLTARGADGELIAEKTIERQLTAEGVTREPIGDPVVGERWLPAGDDPSPGVILLGGSEGGLPPQLPAGLLAARGYAVCRLAYFGVDGTPSTLEGIDLRDVRATIDRFRSAAGVIGDRLGVMGWSRGGELAAQLAATDPSIRATIVWAGSPVRFHGVPDGYSNPDPAWLDGTTALPSLHISPSLRFPARLVRAVLTRRPFRLRPLYQRAFERATDEERQAATIDVGETAGRTLWLSGGDDRLWPSDQLCARVADDPLVEHRTYPEAGHAIGVPYRPLGASLVGPDLLPRVPVALGGSPAANARASEDGWQAALDLLFETLR